MPAAIPLGISAISGLIKMGKSAHQNNLANNVVVPDANYQTSPYAQAMLAQANQYKNSRMTGAADAEQNIDTNQANTIGSIQRNATSGAQALSLSMAAQGNSNNAFNQLRQQEGADQQNKLNNWNNANQQMIGEDDKVYQDRVRKQNLAMNEKNALRGAANANFGGGLNDLSNGVMASNNAGLFNNIGGSTGSTGLTASQRIPRFDPAVNGTN